LISLFMLDDVPSGCFSEYLWIPYPTLWSMFPDLKIIC
jgi:hypothetical protein